MGIGLLVILTAIVVDQVAWAQPGDNECNALQFDGQDDYVAVLTHARPSTNSYAPRVRSRVACRPL